MLQSSTEKELKVLKVTSPAFSGNGNIPLKYTCDGENVNPPLEIGPIPTDAKSLVLIVDDPDAPSGTWLHWCVWNIPVNHRINEKMVPGVQGRNDFGHNNYGGPCPPAGTHRYFFRIYALNDVMAVPEGSLRKDVEDAMRDHIVAYGELTGKYKRSATRKS